MICSCGKKEIVTQGLCNTCYKRQYRATHPEVRLKDIKNSRKYRQNNPEKVREINKAWIKRNPDKRRAYTKNYLDTHPEKKAANLKHLEELNIKKVCNILKAHAEDLKNDPERLTTDFILSLSHKPRHQ